MAGAKSIKNESFQLPIIVGNGIIEITDTNID